MKRSLVVIFGLYVACSLSLWAVSARLDRAAAAETGLRRSFSLQQDAAEPPQVRRRTGQIDLAFLDELPNVSRRFFRVRWEGLWHLPEDAIVDLHASADDRVRLVVDGVQLVEQDVSRGVSGRPYRLALERGFHDLVVSYEQYGGAYSLRVSWAPAGRAPRPFVPETLFPSLPSRENLDRAQRAISVRQLTRAFWVGVPVMLLLVGILRPAMRSLAQALVPPRSTGAEARSIRIAAYLVGAALAVAAVVRYWGIDFGLPHARARPDEQARV